MSPITAVRRGWRVRVVVMVILISGLSAVVAARQDPGGVIALLHQVLSSLATLQESVNALLAANESNVTFTPVVEFQSGELACRAVNITNSARSVQIETIDAITGQLQSSGFAAALKPGRMAGAGLLHAPSVTGFVFCKVTVLNGKSQDMRGALTISPGQDTTDAVVVAAQ